MHIIGPPSHWSPIPLVPHLIGPPDSLVLHFIGPHLIGPLLIGPPINKSPTTLFELIGSPSNWSPFSLVHPFSANPNGPHLTGPPSHWSPISLIPQPNPFYPVLIGPPSHYHNSRLWSPQSCPRQVTGLFFIHKLKTATKWPCDCCNCTSSCQQSGCFIAWNNSKLSSSFGMCNYANSHNWLEKQIKMLICVNRSIQPDHPKYSALS